MHAGRSSCARIKQKKEIKMSNTAKERIRLLTAYVAGRWGTKAADTMVETVMKIQPAPAPPPALDTSELTDIQFAALQSHTLFVINTQCSSCPLLKKWDNGGTATCLLAKNKSLLNFPVNEKRPEWCPVRRRPVTVLDRRGQVDE